MKKALLVLVISCLMVGVSYSQVVSNVPLQDLKSEYIFISPSGYKTNKFSVNLDFGQFNEAYNYKGRLIKDENGKPMEFNSMIDALNFLNNFGYELVEVIADPTEMSRGYFLRRKKQ